MKNTDELNNFNVSNPDGTEHLEESYVSAAENGGERVVDLNSKNLAESQRVDEIPDYRNLSDETSGAAYEFSVTDVAVNTAAGATAATGVAGSVAAGIAASLASVVVAVVVAVAVLIPSIKVSQIFANAYSMAFSVEFSSPLYPESESENGEENENREEKEEVFWYAELTGEDGFSQRAELWEQNEFLEFYDLAPDTPYTLTVYRNEESQYSGVFYTAKEESGDGEIFIEVFDFENDGFRFNFFAQSEEDAKKLYTVRVTDQKGNVVFVEDVSSPREEGFFVSNVKGNAYITVSVGGEVKAFRNVEYWYEPHEPVDLQYFTITFVADGQTVGSYSYRYNEDITYLPDVPYKEGYTGEWGYIPHETATVEAIYTPILELQFTAIFCVDGELYDTRVFTGEYENLTDLPEVPEKPGYYGEWSLPERPGNLVFQIFAEYTPITYTATFVADGNTVETVEFTVETKVINAPQVPEKQGYTGEWEPYRLGFGDIVINAIYTEITYEPEYFTIYYRVDGKEYATAKLYPEIGIVDEPALPEREGYTGEWVYGETEDGTPCADAEYEPITYTATFVADGDIVEIVYFTVEDEAIEEPDFPEKEGYEGAWSDYYLVLEDFTVNAQYEPIAYTAKFVADGATVGERTFTVENENIDEPTVPEKTGYTGVWSEYTLAASDITVNANYTAVTYYAYFYADDELVGDPVPFTVEYEAIEAPEVPVKPDFIGVWETYEITASDITVHAMYTDTARIATFIIDNDVVDTVRFVPGGSINEPLIPARNGYTGKWDYYETTDEGDIYARAVYEPITYTATFIADGTTIGERTFTVENGITDEPQVPAKQGYTGAWENYTLGYTDITVNAVYTAITYTATFFVDREVWAVRTFTVEKNEIDVPEPPEIPGYYGSWEPSPYQLGTENIDIYAYYSPVIYYAYFYADGELIGDPVPFTVEYEAIDEPDFPEKEGYEGYWSEYSIEAGNITVEAIYYEVEVAIHTAYFYAGNNFVASVEFSEGDEWLIYVPQVPEKPGYTGAWENYTLGYTDITVNAVYTAITYTATFIADGEIVAEAPFTVEYDAIPLPEVPQRSPNFYGGRVFDGKWEDYVIEPRDITINAIYTEHLFTATFYDENENVVGVAYFYAYDEVIDEPPVPEKEGCIGYWDRYWLGAEDISIYPYYIEEEQGDYETITFFDVTGSPIEIVRHIFGTPIDEPEVPDVPEGYIGEWDYTETADGIFAYPKYNEATTIYYVVDGVIEQIYTYPIGYNPPYYELPYREGCEGYWEYRETADGIMAIAVYSPIEVTPIYGSDGY